MATDGSVLRTRRALLTAAAGAAGAMAATAALPAIVAADDPNDVVKETDNPTTATTSITDSGEASTAFAGHAVGDGAGYGIEGSAGGAAGLVGWSVSAPAWSPDPFDPAYTTHTGVFGFSPAGDHVTSWGSGVWGDSPDSGVVGTGTFGVEGYGGVGIYGQAYGSANDIAVWAWSPNTAAYALRVDGKVKFSRSGRKSMSTGKAKANVYLAGVTSTSKVFAVLATSEPGRWVRAVVPAAGKFTIYLNRTLASKAVVSWFVLD